MTTLRPKLPKAAPARQPKQLRSQATRERITTATIELLGEIGEARLTHRDVARRAQVPLAATTYYYVSKRDLLADASAALLEDYVRRFRQFADRQSVLAIGRLTFDQFLVRLLRNATGRDRLRTVAWCEILLASARRADTRELAATWYARLRDVWTGIADVLGASTAPRDVQAAIDRCVGLLFIVIPLGLTPDQAEAAFAGGLEAVASTQTHDREASAAHARTAVTGKGGKGQETRDQLLDAAIRLMAAQGAGAATGRAVAAEAGVAPAVPSYYFKPIATLVDAARERLYEAAKARYRESVSSLDINTASLEQIVDITTAVVVREVTQFAALNLATLAVDVEAARQVKHRPMVRQWFRDRTRAWQRLLACLCPDPHPADGLRIGSLFTGMEIRLLATGAQTPALGELRLEFTESLLALGCRERSPTP